MLPINIKFHIPTNNYLEIYLEKITAEYQRRKNTLSESQQKACETLIAVTKLEVERLKQNPDEN